MVQQVDRGIHRDSVNEGDYRKIIEFRKQNISLNEYVQSDAINKDVKSIISR